MENETEEERYFREQQEQQHQEDMLDAEVADELYNK